MILVSWVFFLKFLSFKLVLFPIESLYLRPTGVNYFVRDLTKPKCFVRVFFEKINDFDFQTRRFIA
ncbi:hypothetical protein D320_10404 [Haloferax sp. BAB-2207]|nr:hypothetical protein D320_10404 [Haloferax sp. BAB-2207]